MARNEEITVYGIPEVYKQRTNHHFTQRRKGTTNVGDITPVFCSVLVQPGDTLSMSLTQFYRLTTSLFPSMDNLQVEAFAFAEDWQNVWDSTKDFWGEDEATPFEELAEKTIPQIVVEPNDAIAIDDIIHHLALPPMEANKSTIPELARTQNIEISRLGYNTYIDIYNRYFRDQNYIPKIAFSKGDEDVKYSEIKQKKLLKAARFNDYFSGAPEPQKGEPTYLPLGTEAPVIGNGYTLGVTNGTQDFGISRSNVDAGISGYLGVAGQKVGENIASGGDPTRLVYGISTDATKSGLIADLTKTLGATINALRMKTVEQQLKEQMLWFGSRFEEIINAQWGVSVDPIAMRIPEYLGSVKMQLNMDTVLQTSSTDTKSPQGNAAGYSATKGDGFLFTKSFKTWNIVMIVVLVRQDHTYAQGVENQWQKKRRFDFYNDAYAGLGAQPRYIREICITGTKSDNDTWNFAPAWREYMSAVDRAVGLMVPGIPDSLAAYTYTDEYKTVPNAGEDWINETPAYVDRTLVVPSETTQQLMYDIMFDINLTSIVKKFRLPGIDKI